MSIYEELLQNLPYPHRSEELVVNLLLTSALLSANHEEFLKPYGLTGAQYNVLRILRGAHRSGELLGRNDIRRRMVNRFAPDMTRMLARLETAGLVERNRFPPPGYDQRVVLTQITPKGLALLASIDPELTQRNDHMGKCLSEREQQTLIELLDRFRQNLSQMPKPVSRAEEPKNKPRTRSKKAEVHGKRMQARRESRD